MKEQTIKADGNLLLCFVKDRVSVQINFKLNWVSFLIIYQYYFCLYLY